VRSSLWGTVDGKEHLENALRALGDVLEARALAFDLVLIGGAVLVLTDVAQRPTDDLDVVALVRASKWTKSKPLPEALVQAVRDVADALDLPREPRDDKDWLNPGPSVLFELGLPEGFKERVEVRRFGPLTIRIAGRQDLVTLKLWAATDTRRGSRRVVDIEDLAKLRPTDRELEIATQWCADKDGRDDFVEMEIEPVLHKLHQIDGSD